MSETKFTPGPWVVYPETDGTEICAVNYTPGLPIRQIIARPDRGANWISNARLIAAAPDMYKELEEALNVFRFYQFHHASKGHSEKEQNNKQYADNIEKVLAKARGEG